MIALCKTKEGKGNVELQEFKKPSIKDNEVLINVKATGICGSDLHIYNWDIQIKMKPPVVMGHEFSGVIEAVGSAVESLKVGDRVTAEPSYEVCGKCIYCMEGRYNLCNERKVMGYWADGAFAPYTVAPEHRVHRLPDNVSFEEGALTEPLACCVHGVHELVKVRMGETVVVTGPGSIGILAAQAAKAACAKVIMVGTTHDAKRLSLAEELGIDKCINIESENAEDIVKDMTDGNGADVALECSGAEAAVNTNFSVLRKGGRFLQLGLFGRPITSQFESVVYKELEVLGSFSQKWSAWKLSLKMMKEQRVKLAPVISDSIPLKEWEIGFSKMNKKEGLKILLIP